jgi:hypothetical protein
MHEPLRAELAAILDEVRDAAIPDACKNTVAWCVQELPALYSGLCDTQESRYADEIARLAQGLLKELAGGGKEARKLAEDVACRLRALHERFGLPRVNVKLPAAASSRSRKTG